MNPESSDQGSSLRTCAELIWQYLFVRHWGCTPAAMEGHLGGMQTAAGDWPEDGAEAGSQDNLP